MEKLPYSHLTKGTFLIASPDLIGDELFFRSVILLCEHHSEGSLGILINKPLVVEIPEEILNLGQASNARIQTRAGGPNQPNQLMLLHTSEKIIDHMIKVCEGVYLGGDLQFLQELIGDSNGPNVYLCFGYCSWGPGELEHEFLTGNWFVTPATQKHIFETPPEQLWRSLLLEMGGKYASLSTIPDDLSLN